MAAQAQPFAAQGIPDIVPLSNMLAQSELATPVSPDAMLEDTLNLASLTYGSVAGTEAHALSLWTALHGAADRMSRDRLASFIELVEDDASLKEFFLLHAGDVGPHDDGKPSENEAELRIRLSHYAGTAIKQLAQLLKREAALAADRELSAASRNHRNSTTKPDKSLIPTQSGRGTYLPPTAVTVSRSRDFSSSPRRCHLREPSFSVAW